MFIRGFFGRTSRMGVLALLFQIGVVAWADDEKRHAHLAGEAQTKALVDAVVRHPRDQNRWEPLRAPERRADALRLLTAAFNDPANARKEEVTWIRNEGGRDDILEAIAGIFEDDAWEILVKGARDADADVRCEAIEQMGWRKIKPRQQVSEAIRGGLRDSQPQVVIAALRAIVSRPDPEAGAAVLELLRHPPAIKRKALDQPVTYNAGEFSGYTTRPGFDDALQAIGATGYAGALEDLFVLARDASAHVRAGAADAIGPCAANAGAENRGDAVRVLRGMLDDPNPAVCLQAAIALAKRGDSAGAPVLIFKLQKGTRPAREHEYFEREFDLPVVQAMEKLTGEDFGSSLGDAIWTINRSDNSAESAKKFETAVSKVKLMIAHARARGLAIEGYPRLPEKLTEADKAMFDRAMAKWLVDPRGGVWITFDYDERTAWGKTRKTQLKGWLFPARGDLPARVLLDDRMELPAPQAIKPLDIVAETREEIKNFRDGRESYASPIRAAWLYRLGHEDLAAQELYIARGAGDRADISLDQPGGDGAWFAFSSAVHAFLVHADDEALMHAQRLEKLYPAYLESYGPGRELLADLRRRKVEGTLNRAPMPKPDNFANWTVEKRIKYLIADLENIDSRQEGQPGGVDISADWRVRELIDIGEVAIPDLIDCIEKDERLTRSIHFWRDFALSRGMIGVREVALTAAMSILGTSVFEAASTGDDFSARGEEQAKATARKLRKYWDEFRKLPYDQRMMRILTDPKSKAAAALEAAENLANLGDQKRIGTMVWTGGVDQKRLGRNPAIGKFRNPSVAEAILAARDRNIQSMEASKDDGYARRREDEEYAEALMALGDKSIVTELRRRFEADTDLELRRRWAVICFVLNDDAPLRVLAAGFKAGSLPLPANDRDASYPEGEPGNRELASLIWDFTRAGAPFTDEALFALAERGHPYNAIALKYVEHLLVFPDSSHEYVWYSHPYFVKLMRPLLDRTQGTGQEYTIANETRHWTRDDGTSFDELPGALAAADPGMRRTSAAGRLCDRAAIVICEHVVGAPAYHPLLKSADQRLAELKVFVDRYGATLRPLSDGERAGTGFNGRLFIPSFSTSGKVATAADTAAGRAIFHLSGNGRVAKVPLPASAMLRRAANGRRTERVLIVQAEYDAQGRLHYGIIERNGMREANADELTDVRPVSADQK